MASLASSTERTYNDPWQRFSKNSDTRTSNVEVSDCQNYDSGLYWFFLQQGKVTVFDPLVVRPAKRLGVSGILLNPTDRSRSIGPSRPLLAALAQADCLMQRHAPLPLSLSPFEKLMATIKITSINKQGSISSRSTVNQVCIVTVVQNGGSRCKCEGAIKS